MYILVSNQRTGNTYKLACKNHEVIGRKLQEILDIITRIYTKDDRDSLTFYLSKDTLALYAVVTRGWSMDTITLHVITNSYSNSGPIRLIRYAACEDMPTYNSIVG